jgi:hypothetical protein
MDRITFNKTGGLLEKYDKMIMRLRDLQAVTADGTKFIPAKYDYCCNEYYELADFTPGIKKLELELEEMKKELSNLGMNI